MAVAASSHRGARPRPARHPWRLAAFAGVVALAGLGFLVLDRAPGPTRPVPLPAAPAAEAQGKALDAIAAQLAGLGGVVEFRDPMVYRFGPDDERAVCGQLRTAAAPNYRDFVVRVMLAPGSGPPTETVVAEDTAGSPVLFRAWQRYCRGPAQVADRLRAIGRQPPVAAPASAPPWTEPAGNAVSPAASNPVPAAMAATPDRPSVTVRSPVNLRTAPHGAVLRVLPRGEVLQVFGQAPGGWLQVGQGEAWGWAHSSLLDTGG